MQLRLTPQQHCCGQAPTSAAEAPGTAGEQGRKPPCQPVWLRSFSYNHCQTLSSTSLFSIFLDFILRTHVLKYVCIGQSTTCGSLLLPLCEDQTCYPTTYLRRLLGSIFKPIESLYQQVTTLGFWDFSIDSPEPFSFSTKPHPGFTLFSQQEQLAKNRTVESKSKVYLGTSPELWTLMDQDFVHLLASVAACVLGSKA